MVIIKYLDLDLKLKQKLSGSISNYFKVYVTYLNYNKVTAEETFQGWLYSCTDMVDNKRYYRNKSELIIDHELDTELLQDLKEIFGKRLHSKVERMHNKSTSEKATEKQIKYANKLYNKIYGEAGTYKNDNYTKDEIGKIIDNLKKVEDDLREPAKVIKLR